MNVSELEIKYIGDEVLAEKSKKIEKIDDEIKELSKNMIDIMYKTNGVGLAAPQVGINYRLVVIDIKEYEKESFRTPGEILLIPQMPIVLINPEITAFSQETEEMEEGCLSVPGLYAPVERPIAVNLRTEMLSGEKLNLHCGGYLARVLQHELDHLDGILYVDRLSDATTKKIKSKIKKLQKKLQKRVAKK